MTNAFSESKCKKLEIYILPRNNMSTMFTIEMLESLIEEKNVDRDILVHTEHGHFKVYIITWYHDERTAYVQYGRIGNGLVEKAYSFSQAMKKKREKLNKGYRLVDEAAYKSLRALS